MVLVVRLLLDSDDLEAHFGAIHQSEPSYTESCLVGGSQKDVSFAARLANT